MGYDDTLRDFRSFIIEGERACMDEVTSVAIDHVDVEAKRPWEAYNKAAFLRSFPKLEEVILVLCEGRREAALEEDLELVEPRRPSEQLMDIWDEFWQGLNMEEKLLEDACRAMGKKYTKWRLPTFQIKTRPSKALIVDNGPRTQSIERII
jgi:AcrR family transcriptional regulator